MGKLSVESARNSIARGPSTGKRQSGLEPSVINAMFPDAAAAIATEKAKFTQQTGTAPQSNRNSTVDRNSLLAPTISGPDGLGNENGQSVSSPWGTERPKSSTGQTPMGQFAQPPPSAGLRSPRPQISGNQQIKSTTISTGDKSDLPLLSPYGPSGGNWASMVNTPLVANFNQQQPNNQADMVANATAMKLAALSTVNNRFALDDPRRYRRARSNDAPGAPLSPNMQGMSMGGQPLNIVMSNERGQVLTAEQMIALQHQQLTGGDRSRPNSPGIAMQGGMQGGFQAMGAFASPQSNGFLNPYSGTSPLLNNGMGGYGLGGLTIGSHHEGYLSDHSDMNRGRSPRGRRGTSKPPEDPTDPTLLQDIPAWLRSLRLHKYTDNLKDLKWNELVELDDKELENRGVNALGARRKMLKVFEQVKGR